MMHAIPDTQLVGILLGVGGLGPVLSVPLALCSRKPVRTLPSLSKLALPISLGK